MLAFTQHTQKGTIDDVIGEQMSFKRTTFHPESCMMDILGTKVHVIKHYCLVVNMLLIYCPYHTIFHSYDATNVYYMNYKCIYKWYIIGFIKRGFNFNCFHNYSDRIMRKNTYWFQKLSFKRDVHRLQ